MTASDCRKKRLSLYVTLLPAPQTPSTPSSFFTESRATIFIIRTCFPPILTGYVNLSAFPFLSGRYLNHALRAPLNEDGSGARELDVVRADPGLVIAKEFGPVTIGELSDKVVKHCSLGLWCVHVSLSGSA